MKLLKTTNKRTRAPEERERESKKNGATPQRVGKFKRGKIARSINFFFLVDNNWPSATTKRVCSRSPEKFILSVGLWYLGPSTKRFHHIKHFVGTGWDACGFCGVHQLIALTKIARLRTDAAPSREMVAREREREFFTLKPTMTTMCQS